MTPATEALVERLEAGDYRMDDAHWIVDENKLDALVSEAADALRAQGDEMKRMQARLDRWEPKITSSSVSVSYGVGGNNAPLSADHVSDPRQTVDPTIRDFRIVAEPPAGEE